MTQVEGALYCVQKGADWRLAAIMNQQELDFARRVIHNSAPEKAITGANSGQFGFGWRWMHGSVRGVVYEQQWQNHEFPLNTGDVLLQITTTTVSATATTTTTTRSST